MATTKIWAIKDSLQRVVKYAENPKGKTPRSIYFAEKRGESTKYNLMREAIDKAMKMCVNYAQFKRVMYKMGYIIQNDYNEKYPTIKSINDKKATRMYHLGEEYLPHIIAYKVNQNPYYYQERFYNYMYPTSYRYRQRRTYRYRGSFNNMHKLSSLEMLFLIFLYLLGYTPKQTTNYAQIRKTHQPLSPEMKQERIRMNWYIRETNLIIREKFETIADVKAFITKTETIINYYIDKRQKYRNQLRNCKKEKDIAEYRKIITACTNTIQDYRKDIQTANRILQNTSKIRKTIKIEKQAIREQYEIEKNKTKNKKRDRDAR